MKQEYKEIHDEKGRPIIEVTAIVNYLDGIVIGTKNGVYTNVKSLIEGDIKFKE